MPELRADYYSLSDDMGLNPAGRNWGPVVNWDDLGKFYTAIAIIWTIILCSGITWLVLHRNQQFIRIRNLPIAITSTVFLHIYLIKILLAYTTNGHFLCSAEFWIMNIYLPFGIAFFHANLVQLQSISRHQRRLFSNDDMTHDSATQKKLSVWGWLRASWQGLTSAQKSYIFIGISLVVQVIVTLAIYLTNPKLQGYWVGVKSYADGQAKCRKGIEWTPSAFWQLFWAWVCGPYTLYKIRNIHDVHHWRLQVILCVVSGLPGTPLWLAALWSPSFKPINPWFVPPMWLAPGIMVMQACTIFFPVYESVKYIITSTEFSDTGTLFEKRSLAGESTTTSDYPDNRSSDSLHLERPDSQQKSPRSREIYGMAALEKALVKNPGPLLHFAATKDFTAENITFLTQVRDWRSAWKTAPRKQGSVTQAAQFRLFQAASEIFSVTVDPHTAAFPINLDHRTREALNAVFKSRNHNPAPNPDPVDPFNAWSAKYLNRELSSNPRANKPKPIVWEPSDYVSVSVEESKLPPHPGVRPFGHDLMVFDAAFDESVFDAAEQSVKYLVLTNTWRKFVDAQVGDHRVKVVELRLVEAV